GNDSVRDPRRSKSLPYRDWDRAYQVENRQGFGDPCDYGPPIVTTSTVVTRTVEKSNDGFQTVGTKKRTGKSKSTNGSQFARPSVKQTVRYEPKATTNTPKKGAANKGNESISLSLLKNWGNSLNKDNITSSNSFSALNVEEEDEEEVENVYDETANLFTKTCGSSFTAAAG
ncbi:hypothetical protein Tco_0723892, partial [Tanacetum coccineum]